MIITEELRRSKVIESEKKSNQKKSETDHGVTNYEDDIEIPAFSTIGSGKRVNKENNFEFEAFDKPDDIKKTTNESLKTELMVKIEKDQQRGTSYHNKPEQDTMEMSYFDDKSRPKREMKVFGTPKPLLSEVKNKPQMDFRIDDINHRPISVFNFINNPVPLPGMTYGYIPEVEKKVEQVSHMDNLIDTISRTKKKHVSNPSHLIRDDVMKVLDNQEMKVFIRVEKFDRVHSQPHIRYHINMQNLTNEAITDIDVKYKTDSVDFKLMLNKTHIATPLQPYGSKNIDFLIFLFDFPFANPQLIFCYTATTKGVSVTRSTDFELPVHITKLIKFVHPSDNQLTDQKDSKVVTRIGEFGFNPHIVRSEVDIKEIIDGLYITENTTITQTFEGFFSYILDQSHVYKCTLTVNYAKNIIIMKLAMRDDSRNGSKEWILDKLMAAFKNLYELY